MNYEDYRGLACPAPVIKVKQLLERAAGSPVKVIVDAGASHENVVRFAKTRGCSILEEELESGWQITLQPDISLQAEQQAVQQNSQAVILISSDRLGEGADDLGRLLMKNFIITLLEFTRPPDVLFFINSGVLLTSDGSELLEPLDKLANAGTEVFSCGVCLDYYGLRDKLVAGSVTNMYTIVEKMLTSGNSLRI